LYVVLLLLIQRNVRGVGACICSDMGGCFIVEAQPGLVCILHVSTLARLSAPLRSGA
jgi:hypothetical protein